jgi:nucleoid-associated protein YgaU
LGITFGAPCLWSQNLGDIARQDRERRSRLAIHAPVITNDDLAREHILTPELMNQILRTQAGKGAAVPLPPPALVEYVPLPINVGMDQELRIAALQPPAIEVIQPAGDPAQALAPEKLGEYARQLRASHVANLDPQPLPASPAETSVVAREPEISLGEFARQLRASRVAQAELTIPEVAATSAAPQRDEAISLGEYARQIQSHRHLPEPLAIAGVAPDVPVPGDAGQPVSLGAYARELRAVRSVPAYESASITPLPPRPETTFPAPEISLGDYARQLRMRHSAEEYFRLLAQDDTDIAAGLRQANAPLRFHEVRATQPPSLARERRQPTAVVHSQANERRAAKRQIAVTVRRGDSLWRLARIYLGSGARWQSISFLNRHSGSPDLIRAGEVILVPVGDRRGARNASIRRRQERGEL